MATTLEWELDPGLLRDGEALLKLHLRSRHWVKRRIEVICFDDHLSFRRTTTLDLDLSPEHIRQAPRWRERMLLPVKLLDRDVSLNITLSDAGGQPLPQLTRRHERALVAAGLTAYYLRAGAPMPASGPSGLYRGLLKMIDPELFGDLAAPALPNGSDGWKRLTEEFANYRFVIAAVLHQGPPPKSASTRWRRPKRQVDDPLRVGSLLRLSVHHAQNLPPRDGDTEAVDRSLEHAEDSDDASAARRSGGLEGVAGDHVDGANDDDEVPILGRDEHLFAFPVEQLEYCESFHFEVQAPPGLYIHAGQMFVKTSELVEVFESGQVEEVRRRQQSLETDPHADIAHFFWSVPSEWSHDVAIESSWVEVVFRPMTVGITRSGLTTMALASLVLAALVLSVGWAAVPVLPSVGPRIRPNIEAVVASLLIGPTLLTVVLVRESEHPMTKRLLTPFRVRLASTGGATFVGAMLLAIGVGEVVLLGALVTLALVSAGLTVVTLQSYRQSTEGLKDSRARPTRPDWLTQGDIEA